MTPPRPKFARDTIRHATLASHCRRRLHLMAAAMVAASLIVSSVASAAAPQQWAVIIAVKDHTEDQLDLQFSGDDAKSLERVLVERAGLSVSEGQILELSDLALAGEQRRPTKQNIEREVPALLAQAGPDDRLIVFYSGHAMLHDGELFLAPADFRFDSPETSGIAVRWLQDALRTCRAKTKFLILDSCHAGGAHRVSTAVEAARIAKAVDIEEIGGCVVLASCRSNEQSWEWPARRNGVFTYWLCRALEGGADADGDGTVTSDEVYEYTHERVRTTVEQVFHTNQTPVRLIGEDVAGDPALLTLRPEPPESVCRRLAESLDLEIRFRHLKRVGVLEFLNRASQLSQANLPAYCAGAVRGALMDLAGDAYQVLSEDETRAAAKGVRVADIDDPVSVRKLAERDGGVDGLIIGDLRRSNHLLRVQCELVTTRDGQTVTGPTGVMPLSEDLLADNGASFDNLQRPTGDAYADSVVTFADAQAHEGHPLLQKDFPFDVSVQIVEASATDTITEQTPRHKREFEVRHTDEQSHLVLPARDGEIFELSITSRYKDKVTVAVLVDGINVLGQKRERLATARRWHQRPNQTCTYEGWYIPKPQSGSGNKQDFERRRFIFTNLAESVAGRQGFSDSLGLITIAFFDAQGKGLPDGQTLAVGEAQSDDQTLNSVPFADGRLLSVVQIRYVDAGLRR